MREASALPTIQAAQKSSLKSDRRDEKFRATQSSTGRTLTLEPDEFPDCRQKRLRLLQRRAVAATGQLNIAGAGNGLGDLLVQVRRGRLVEFAAHDKRRHLHAMQYRRQIRLLQYLA